MENSCWNLKVEGKNHKKDKMQKEFLKTLVFVEK